MKNSAQHELRKEKADDRKQLYEASHLNLMIAIIQKTYKKTTTKKTSPKAKTTSHINMQRKFQFSPLDGAHYAKSPSNLAQNR